MATMAAVQINMSSRLASDNKGVLDCYDCVAEFLAIVIDVRITSVIEVLDERRHDNRLLLISILKEINQLT